MTIDASLPNLDMFHGEEAEGAAEALQALAVDPSKWEGNVGKLLEAVTYVLKRYFGQERADQLAPEVVMSTVDALGGHITYWPKAESLKQALRDAQIGACWFDRNYSMPQLIDTFKLTPPRLYAIIAAQKELRRRKSPDLFGFDGAKK